VNDRVSDFFSEIGVELVPVQPESKARYIYRKGKMRRFPLTFAETLHTLRRFFSKPARPVDPASASLADWARAHIGEPVLRNLLAPFVTGVYAATPEELRLSTAFPSLVPTDPRRSLFWNVLAARKKPGRDKKRPTMMTPKDGMGSVIQKLKDLLGPDLHLNHPIQELPDVPNLVVCVPPPELARLIETSDPDSAKALRAVNASPLVTITVFARSEDFRDGSPRGVGVLIPRNEGLRILGVLFNSSSFPGRALEPGTVSMTVMLGGTTDPDAVKLGDEEIGSLITRELETLLGFHGNLLHREITRWTLAIPVYSQALQDARVLLSNGFLSKPGRVLFTNYSKDVSIRGMIDALRAFP
jgi:oxygen-dependent protoporphyrinogen oxidase